MKNIELVSKIEFLQSQITRYDEQLDYQNYDQEYFEHKFRIDKKEHRIYLSAVEHFQLIKDIRHKRIIELKELTHQYNDLLQQKYPD